VSGKRTATRRVGTKKTRGTAARSQNARYSRLTGGGVWAAKPGEHPPGYRELWGGGHHGCSTGKEREMTRKEGWVHGFD